ncbi:hypothetical protein [Actinopolyspora saharensis]|uniref:PE family protein n=1 Tax=Actinopolyspora saharensis TaxID=995062 RepID=A0A1H1E2D6_9ACTN|nr:hypothetical protein [Actinopolyspora saharensis]SDQ82915.1 hypothetical protein SAMN04489718_2345 [Actinopolyspora saharensis]
MPEKQDLTGNLSATNDAMRGIVTAADKGEFTITPEAGDELIQIFQELEDWLRTKLREIRIVKRDTPLGESPAGQAISGFNKEVAGGDDKSLEHLLTSMRSQTPGVVEAIRKGIAAYQELDERNKQNLDGIQ